MVQVLIRMAEENKQIISWIQDEVSNTADFTQSYSANSSMVNVSRPLPPGKLYHVFFSHCSEDREWVMEMVDRLESPEYGFKCCYADRDFDLGIPVFQNITKCIHTSKRTVIVMSPEFLQSPWCSYETRITLELDLDTRQRLLIPVMLRSCRIPDFIGRLTYMEVQNEHFLERFVAAIVEDDSTSLIVQACIGSSAIMTGVPFQFNPHFHNTDEIVDVTVYQGCDYCSVSPSDFVPNELMRNGLQLTPDEYRDIVTVITDIFYVACHGCFNKSIYVLPIASALLMILIFTLSFFVLRSGDRNSALGYGYASLALLIFCLALLFIFKSCTLVATRRISRAIENANTIANKRDLLVTIKEYGWCSCTCDKMAIIFYYYDWKPCHSHLTEFLTERYRTTSQTRPHDLCDLGFLIDQTEICSTRFQDKAWDLLVKHATEYCQLLLNRRSVTQSEQRHTRQRECLCQFVESILVSGETSCCDCIFGVRSRHPWRRYCLF